MNRLLSIAATVFFTVQVYSQQSSSEVTPNVDPRIVEVFGDQLENLVLNNKDRLESLTFLLNERVKIVEIPYWEGEGYTKLSEVPLFNPYNKDLKRDEDFNPYTFNVLKYNMNFHSRGTQYYRVDNSIYVIKILNRNLKDK
ncbi:hypothetical protein AB4865_05680 [Capnocytophaga sp. ARDL2]|uniref:hypothetical protein n=1 Tax=Capnocytophaga sp. ARDL2 TaxID=3238809 RepID=UPI003556014E